MAVATELMTSFKNSGDLEQYLKRINPDYGQYATGLFSKGVTSSSQLGNASLAVWVECGVTSVQHVEDIRARSKGKGKSAVSACSYWPAQVLDIICRALHCLEICSHVLLPADLGLAAAWPAWLVCLLPALSLTVLYCQLKLDCGLMLGMFSEALKHKPVPFRKRINVS